MTCGYYMHFYHISQISVGNYTFNLLDSMYYPVFIVFSNFEFTSCIISSSPILVIEIYISFSIYRVILLPTASWKSIWSWIISISNHVQYTWLDHINIQICSSHIFRSNQYPNMFNTHGQIISMSKYVRYIHSIHIHFQTCSKHMINSIHF